MHIEAKKTNILLVDDQSSNLLALESILQDLDQNLIFARTGKEALKQVIKHDFSVILMDIQIPDMSGFEIAEHIRKRRKSEYIPIIFLTAYYKNDIDIARGYQIGAVDYIFKPIIPNILRSKVKFFVDFFTKSSLASQLQNELIKQNEIKNQIKYLKEKFEIVLNTIGEGIIGLNSEFNITFLNRTALELLKANDVSLIGKPLQNILSRDPELESAIKTYLKIVDHLEKNNIMNIYDTCLYTYDGGKIPVDYTITANKKLHDDISYILAFKDITQRKKAIQLANKQAYQLKLEHSSKLSSIEETITAFSHQLNQPLAAIANYINGLMIRIEKNQLTKQDILKMLSTTYRQAIYAGKIIHRIKNLVCRNEENREIINLKLLINFILELFDQEIKQNKITINFKCECKLPTIIANKIQIEQVILNILRNAIEALNKYKNKLKQITINCNPENEKFLKISISDNGPGFSQKTQEKLFNAYFTTKTTGMGIGLAICRSIVESHQGTLTARNTESGGACFDILLPVRNREE